MTLRDSGRSPRQLQTNPRAMGTNQSAGTERDARRVANIIRRAMQRVHDGDEVWCERCADEGVVDVGGGYAPCPEHRAMTSREAWKVLERPLTMDHYLRATERRRAEAERRRRKRR